MKQVFTFFAERRKRADFSALRRILGRQGGEPPRPGDEVADELHNAEQHGRGGRHPGVK